MWDLLKHLWPDFSQMLNGTTNGISAWFWSLTFLIFALSLFFLFKHYRNFIEKNKALRSLLDGQDRETLADSRRETLQKAKTLNADNIGLLWQEFDESLVLSSDKKQLFNTIDAEHFFNAKNLATGLTSSRLLAATPSFLVAIGVLGTFVGLTIGLEGLVGNTTEIETLKSGINKLISGAAVAFMTSVWGVTFSLLLNLLEKLFERSALNHIQDLQNKIDFLYPRLPAEQSLVHIAEHSKESKEALQELHERIGDRLQESINGMSEAMQNALTDTLNNIMGPAIQTLVHSTNQQSSQVMENLVSSFMEGMSSAGRVQGEQLEKVAADVNIAVSSMGERLEQLFSKLSSQQTSSLDAQDEQSKRFQEQLQQLANSADERQGQLESRFGKMMGDLAQQHEQQQTTLLEQQQKMLGSLGTASQQQIEAMTSAVQQQQNTLQDAVGKLLDNLSQQGAQADVREQIRQDKFQQQLTDVTQQQQALLTALADSVQAGQQQSRQMAEQHQQLLTRLQQVTDSAAQSSKHMDSSANQLSLLSTNVRSAADLLGQRLEQVTQQIEQAGSQNAALTDQLKQQAEMLARLQDGLLMGAERFEQAASEARHGFVEMKQTQQQFLTGVRTEFNALGETLRSQVEAIEKQAEQWLQKYASEVSTQVHERMDQWNKVSLEYATKMYHTAEAMSSVLDELEQR
ncbi:MULTISPECIES: anti-phage ZorAB system protein ZorA [Aeromonas]|uniref:anti-phage ZorAB system protein ZorA n=1 Tax=Aeromonas TaxID=642 RepID=UPI00191CD402|nr:anti-phage ZorAB system protein ZorA [Aeromonas dhakensis]HDX8361533.1 anti-phage defense ZorAB system ZorA [Aeromonas veronii]MBL0463138.1 anti-phage defense ZorAB system ZorA [Aeromonas dhakensis]MBL0604389.1 anti-phage defense ZorAB system ZorA [Aeromonas dhakensis]MBL0620984.1 anti-phage defense ZorAB system ZorA [Aeromonas dhakensis]HDT5886912.1 anti-phage defense ZorAB system ZorA [Aeromonas dhakensis]